jgi:hypothetical protein
LSLVSLKELWQRFAGKWHFGIFHHVCFLARLVRELQREGKGISEEALA